MDQKILKNILEDEGFIKQLTELNTAGEVYHALNERGLGITIDELKSVLEIISEIRIGKLDDKALDLVAGGINLPKKLGTKAAALTLALGTFIGVSTNSAKAHGQNPVENAEDTFTKTVFWTMTVAVPIVTTAITVNYAANLLTHLANFYASKSNSIKNFFYKMTSKSIDVKIYKTVLDRIEKRLKAELVGQDDAIKRIIELMTGYFESVIEAKALNKKFENGLVLYLQGPPATGKSTFLKIIEEEMNLKSCIGRMSDAVEDKGNKANSVASRLIKPITHDDGSVKYVEDTKFTRALKSGIPTLYCFDEIDKMRNLDSVLQRRDTQNRDTQNKDNKIAGGSVDEMIRNFGDTGQINGMNAAGSILIATSNETEDDLKQLESSLYNRYKNCAIKFYDFTSKSYEGLMNRKITDTQEYYKKQYGCDIKWGNSALDYYSKKLEQEKSGGRGIDALMNNARGTLKEYQLKYTKNGKTFKNLKITLNYDERTNKLYAES